MTTRKRTGRNELVADAGGARRSARLTAVLSSLDSLAGRLQRRRRQRVPRLRGLTRRCRDRALCVTADSPSYPQRHRDLAERCRPPLQPRARVHPHRGARTPRVPRQPGQPLLLLQARALHAPVARSPPSAASASIADGSNADDRGDYRPGRQAAREFGVRSPLDEADLTKDEIRELSRRTGLPTWDEPASACLSSRIPYLTEVTDGSCG